MEAHITKSLLRKVMLGYRRQLSETDFQLRNERICEKILALVESEKVKTVHTFLALKRNREPDVTIIFPELRQLGVTLVTSKTQFKPKKLNHFYIQESTILKENYMGIPEPLDAEPADFSKVDLVLVPLSAADKDGDRIGYGGGFYDQLLKEFSGLKIGLSLAPPLDQIAQKQEWDVPLDKILTPFDPS